MYHLFIGHVFLTDESQCSDRGYNLLQLLLSFAVGSLLADVFLHLLPEAWTTAIHGKLLSELFFTTKICS